MTDTEQFQPGGTDGPFYDDLALGDRFDSAPSVTLTEGLAAVHHGIVGGRLRLPLDSRLAATVTGGEPLANPAFVWDISIGQSTLVTQRAIANLFYRDLGFLSAPALGDTLLTATEIVGLRPVSPKPGRPPRGLAVMRIRTVDQRGRPVLDYHRCAMLPARAESGAGPEGLIDIPASRFTPEMLDRASGDWNLTAYRDAIGGAHFADLVAGARLRVAGGDVVTSAPELARLTLNLAALHHDHTVTANGKRLVYGGHTIGLALAQVTRALPALVTVVGWHDCDHTGPVHEGDTLHSTITIERLEPRATGGGFAHLRSEVIATKLDGTVLPVLDWRFVGLFA